MAMIKRRRGFVANGSDDQAERRPDEQTLGLGPTPILNVEQPDRRSLDTKIADLLGVDLRRRGVF